MEVQKFWIRIRKSCKLKIKKQAENDLFDCGLKLLSYLVQGSGNIFRHLYLLK